MTENEVLQSICEYLWYNKILFWRNNNTPTYDVTNKRFRRMPKWSRKGVPDIIGSYKNRLLAIEVKKIGSYPTKEQKELINEINASGGIAFVARSIDDVKKHLT